MGVETFLDQAKRAASVGRNPDRPKMLNPDRQLLIERHHVFIIVTGVGLMVAGLCNFLNS